MRILLTSLFLYTSLTINAQNKLTLLKEKSTLNWTAKNTVTGSYSGTLSFQSGFIEYDEKSLKAAEIIVNMKSLTVENKELQNHLRAEDFFDVESHPISSFSLNSTDNTVGDSLWVKGLMSIIGETVEVNYPLVLLTEENKANVRGKVLVDRTKFGIYHNSSSFMKRMKEKVIADEFEIEFNLYFE